MNVTITKVTTCAITIDIKEEKSIAFPVDTHFLPEDKDTLQWRCRDDKLGYNVAWLCVDDCGFDFWTDLRDNDGTYTEFVRGCDPHEMIAEARKEHGDRVFAIERYEHGLVSYSVAGEIAYPDRQWDVGACGFYIAPEDCTNPAEYAAVTMREYTDWCNGAVYGVVFRHVDLFGTVIEGEECWGLIGYDYAKSEVAATVKNGSLS